MSIARDKLHEAGYFLQRMRESYNSDVLKYDLSAFLSAARSVRWFLRSEYQDAPGFEQWWSSKSEWVGLSKGEQLSDIADPIRAANVFFDEQRKVTIHERSVRPSVRISVEVTEQVTMRSSVEAVVIRADGTRERVETSEPEPAPAPEPRETEPRLEARQYFEDLPPAVDEKDVITLSEEHLDRLEAFLSECESRFGS